VVVAAVLLLLRRALICGISTSSPQFDRRQPVKRAELGDIAC